MRFKHIAITNWRGLYDAELALELDKGLNVVVGPNESGKSTLLEAIRLALTTKASSQKQSLRRIQPWNTDLKPHLELEFSVNDRDYRLTKTYLKSSDNASFAERLEDRNWTTVAEDDDAHSRFLHNLELREG
ncbi:MAG: AAA family ATPase, partial [Candidatus Bipolaricaulota bacterium]